MTRVSLIAAAMLVGCGAPVVLHAPQMAPSQARERGAAVELSPIALAPGAAVVVMTEIKPPPPAVVLTSGMVSELKARALRSPSPSTEAYDVRCALERFAIRTQSDLTASHTLATLYVDLSCEARRHGGYPAGDEKAIVWRGPLRARSAATASSILSTDTGLVQRMVDRMVADASRELASDLAIRALGLRAEPSQRLFADQAVQQDLSGVDDTPYGAPALAENPAAVAQAIAKTSAGDPALRAAAWNVAAMAAGPGDPWMAGERLHLDDDAFVRFFQYKALARLGTKTALEELRTALAREEEPLLAELLRDTLASGGVGLPRTQR